MPFVDVMNLSASLSISASLSDWGLLHSYSTASTFGWSVPLTVASESVSSIRTEGCSPPASINAKDCPIAPTPNASGSNGFEWSDGFVHAPANTRASIDNCVFIFYVNK